MLDLASLEERHLPDGRVGRLGNFIGASAAAFIGAPVLGGSLGSLKCVKPAIEGHDISGNTSLLLIDNQLPKHRQIGSVLIRM